MLKTLELVICNTTNTYKIESLQTFDKSKLNGYIVIPAQFEEHCDKTNDFRIIKEITKIIPDINKLTCMKLTKCELQEIPCCFSALKLRSLDISNNRLRAVPHCLYVGLKELEKLDISSNNLNNFDKVPLCYINLKQLNLSQCRLRNPPKWVLICPNIHEFYYNCNDITEVDGYYSPTCNIKRLEIRNSYMLNKDVDFLKQFPLKYLDLSNEFNYHYNGTLDMEILLDNSKWRCTIQILKCNNLQICDVPKEIKALINLEELHLQQNSLIKLPNEIADLRNLRILDVSKNTLFKLPDSLHRLENLEVFDASSNMLCEVNLQVMLKLKHLDFYDNEIEEININTANLTYLDLDQNHFYANLLCDNYTNKRDALRLIVNGGYARRNGNKELQETQDSSISSFSSSSYVDDEEDDVGDTAEILEDEVWDCENLDLGLVSLSDNEYTGENFLNRKKTVQPKSTPNKDYLFVDAD